MCQTLVSQVSPPFSQMAQMGSASATSYVPQISGPSLHEIPFEVLDMITEHLSQNDLVSFSCLSRSIRHLCNLKLYKNILVIDDSAAENTITHHNTDSYTYLPVSHLRQFTSYLTPGNFKLIRKIVIHSQSNFIVHDYSMLYSKFYSLWDQTPNHNLTLINFDIGNLRHYQSFNQFVFNNSTAFIEDESVSRPVNFKINNLRNWIVFNFEELLELPYNRNLQELDIFIENESLFNSTTLTSNVVPPKLLLNLATIQGLYLNSPISTAMFLNYFKSATTEQPYPVPITHNLTKLSITSSHTHWYESKLSFDLMAKVIDFNKLEQLELKLNCLHHDCNCITEFFSKLQNSVHEPKLKKLILINYKSNNLKQNLYQFNTLLTSPGFLSKFELLESLYLNINDFIRLDTATNHPILFSVEQLIRSVSCLPRLNELIIPDFFNNWLVNLPQFFKKIDHNEDQRTKSYFDVLLNECNCNHCSQTRHLFTSLSNYDSNNNYKHEFKKSMASFSSSYAFPTTTITIENNKSTISFLNYLISKLKQQFKYLNQNLFSINSIINSNDKPFVKNNDLVDYNTLFLHNCLYKLVDLFKAANPSIKSINLGGVLLEYDGQDQFKAPYTR